MVIQSRSTEVDVLARAVPGVILHDANGIPPIQKGSAIRENLISGKVDQSMPGRDYHLKPQTAESPRSK